MLLLHITQKYCVVLTICVLSGLCHTYRLIIRGNTSEDFVGAPALALIAPLELFRQQFI